MRNIRRKIYNGLSDSIISYHIIEQNLIPDRPYDYIWEKDRARRILDHVNKHGLKVGRQCNRIKISLSVNDITLL